LINVFNEFLLVIRERLGKDDCFLKKEIEKD
jgi:hypothetical protein